MNNKINLNQLKSKKNIPKRKYLITILVLFFIIFISYLLAKDAKEKYNSQLSTIIYDRHHTPLSVKENSKGHYVLPLENLPKDFTDLLIKKEDKYFYYHLGINPFSTVRAIYTKITNGKAGGASTITQQLSKNLLGTELDRNILNKIKEVFYSLSLELFTSKAEILKMYTNTVYLGNQVQGFQTASFAYFDKPLKETSHNEKISLLATLSYPNSRNPWEKSNQTFSENLNKLISPNEIFLQPKTTTKYSFQNDAIFELNSAQITCKFSCQTTIDNDLTKKIRNILNHHIKNERERNARNGAVVVIDAKTSEIISLIGSKNPQSQTDGDQINMALQPRPIGSTIKPFIYLEGFIKGLRPYTLVSDREYKYPIATGFSLYPKNYDGQYYGDVTLHQALSNSLNVPSVKILEYIGLDDFYYFLSKKLKFKPIQNYDSYQYGIALGGLEMDLLTLTHYFTLFPRLGTLEPLKILKDSSENFSLPFQSDIKTEETIAEEKYIQLVHAIISDRLTGVNQFGLESSLNINSSDYGLKTGTSRDFHDSWVVGYTADFVVGVWLGNTENQPLKQVTGQSGAGAIWHDVMNLLLETPYNQKTTLPKNLITLFPVKNSSEWGLPDDSVEEHRNLLLDDTLIQSPHHNDIFEYFPNLSIPLKASKEVEWTVNGKILATSKEEFFRPQDIINYEIIAVDKETGKREVIKISVKSTE